MANKLKNFLLTLNIGRGLADSAVYINGQLVPVEGIHISLDQSNNYKTKIVLEMPSGNSKIRGNMVIKAEADAGKFLAEMLQEGNEKK
jgi:hypothetical protein